MPDEAERHEWELEESPVAKRLRKLDWPKPGPEAKQRGLEQIMQLVRRRAAESAERPDGDAEPPADTADGNGSGQR